MKRPDLPYLDYKSVKGYEYIYFRKGQTWIRLPNDPDTPEFSAAYWEARRGKVNRISETTWRALIVDFYGSPSFRSKSPRTRRNYRSHCEAIREMNGDLDVRKFKHKDALKVQAALQDTWSKANERIAVLSILLNHAKRLGWIDANPAAGITKLKGGSYTHWPDSKLAAYEAYCDKHGSVVARTVYEIAIGTGQRLGDCANMRWDDYNKKKGVIWVVQEKTGIRGEVPCPRRLQTYLDSLERSGDYIIAKSSTEPLGLRQVQDAIAQVREAIGVMRGKSRLVPHGWRYTAAKQLADAGCSVQMIQAVTGHSSLSMALKYADGANRTKLARDAQAARELDLAKQEQTQDETETCETDCETLSQPPIRKRRKGKNDEQFQYGAGEGTRTPTPKAPEPKSGASTNFATPALS